MPKIKMPDWFEKLPDEQQKLIGDVVFATVGKCNELCDEMSQTPIVFPEYVAYKIFMKEVLEHVYNNEYYDVNTKSWKSLKQEEK